jgi:hypothetical protein
MDRDVVNALHQLYQSGQIQWSDLQTRLWCPPDSRPDLEGLTEESSDGVKLCQHLIRFIKAVEGQLANLPRPDYVFGFPLSQLPRKPGERRPAFVAMPYGPAWFKSVRDSVEKAACEANFTAEVSKDLATPGFITDQIWHGIRRCDVVVADISEHNPNVFYELGLAHGLGKEVVLITQTGEKAPFDISTARRITYNVSDLPALEASLVNAFKAVSARYPYEGMQPYF